MYVLTIRQPYAALIVHGPKRVENRTRRIIYRGPVLIHAASFVPSREVQKAYADFAEKFGLNPRPSLEYGGIIGVANVIDCFRPGETPNRRRDDQNEWFYFFRQPNTFGWLLDDVQPTPHLACKGRLGLWRLEPPAEWLRQLSPEAAALCR